MSSPAGYCPTCALSWRDHEPGDTLRCPKCEKRVILVWENEAIDDSEANDE